MPLAGPLRGPALTELLVEFDRDRIAAYAEASGDRNPIHLDDDFARSVGLPGVIAHGMLQMGLLATALSREAGDHRRLRRLSVRFAGMVVPGDAVRFSADGTVLGAVNQRGEAVLSKLAAELD